MATVQAVVSDEGTSRDGSVKLVLWEALTGTNLDGSPLKFPEWADRTVQMVGNFDTCTVTMQGSNDGSTWFTLTDPLGNNVALTAAGGKTILEQPLWVRPLLSSAGGSSDVDVYLLIRRPNNMRA